MRKNMKRTLSLGLVFIMAVPAVHGRRVEAETGKASMEGEDLGGDIRFPVGEEMESESLEPDDSRDGLLVRDQELASRIFDDYSGQAFPAAFDEGGFLTVTEAGSSVILDQSALEGRMTKSSGEQRENVSYYIFPETSAYQSMSLDLTVEDYYITGQAAKNTGVFVGAFQLESPQSFVSLGFRGYESSLGTDSLSGYWLKNTGSAGNGSPKYTVEKNRVYHIEFEKTRSNGYWVYFTNTETGVTAQKQFKASEQILTTDDEVCFGLALAGARVRVKNLLLKDEGGRVLYDQNDYFTEAGTAPVVNEISSVEISGDRRSIEVIWEGEGASGDGRYVVEVSRDGGDYVLAAETSDTSYSYEVESSGSYRFQIYGICGEETTLPVYSDRISCRLPISAPDGIRSSNTGGRVTIEWNPQLEADSYDIYRSTEKNGSFIKAGSTTEAFFVDVEAELEQPYYYYVVSIGADDYSNPSDKVFIMASEGHSGEYLYGREAPEFTITARPMDTVLEKDVFLEGTAEIGASVTLIQNGDFIGTSAETFHFDIELEEGRNEITLVVESGDGRATRKTLNIVYLTAYDILVDGSFTGEEGSVVSGVPVYRTAGRAIEEAGEGGAVIFIRNGRYYEKLIIDKRNIVLLGEDSEGTVLCYDAASGSRDQNGNAYGTSGSASITIEPSALSFSAENLTMSNEFDYITAAGEGFQGTQAVALLNQSEGSVFTNVNFLGYQDTLYAHSNNQYYYKCRIEGNVDYIFGGARAVFEDCDIISLLPGYVTAASTEESERFGYVFENCRILGAEGLREETVYLGRPWRQGASVTYINCYLDRVVRSVGYCDMSGNRYQDARFTEYGSYGPGFAVNSNRIQLSLEEAEGYKKSEVFGAFDADARYRQISGLYKAEQEQTDENNGFESSGRAVPTGDSSGKRKERLEWKQDSLGWWLETESGYAKDEWRYVEGKWYLFDSRGYMVTGWCFRKEKWYFLNGDGSMASGWVLDRGKWYYLNRDGEMLVDEVSYKGKNYYFEKSGACINP